MKHSESKSQVDEIQQQQQKARKRSRKIQKFPASLIELLSVIM
jgi:hypothetical protein